jgi:exodeoxyribonuclease VII large subunit
MRAKVERYENRLIAVSGRLDGLSPAKKLSTGFGYVTDGSGNRVDSVEMLSVGDAMTIRIKDGSITGRVTGIESLK